MEVWKVVQEERKAVCVADLFLRGDKKIRNVLRIPDVVGDFFYWEKLVCYRLFQLQKFQGTGTLRVPLFRTLEIKKLAQPDTVRVAAYRTEPKNIHIHNAAQRRGQEGKSARRGDGLRNCECFPFSQISTLYKAELSEKKFTQQKTN